MRNMLALVLALTLPAVTPAQQPRVTEQVSGVTSTVQAVSPVNERIVWASGTAGMVLRTVDGGDTWERHPVPDVGRLQFRGVHAISATEAWVLSIGNGPDSRIYHTVDGGAIWIEQFRNTDSTAFYDCITFFDAKHGVAYGDYSQGRTMILRTEDAGTHWDLLPANDVPAPLKDEGGFASSNSCAISVDSKHGWIAAGTPRSRVFRTDNAGRTWTVAGEAPVIKLPSSGLTAIAFRDTKHGIGVGGLVSGNMTRDTTPDAVTTTDDGGVTWTLRHRPAQPGMLSGVTLVPRASDNTVVTATYTGVQVSTDGGDSWTGVASGYYWAVRATGKRAWAVGNGGKITRLDF